MKDCVIHQKVDNLHAFLLVAALVTALGNLKKLFNFVKQLAVLLVNFFNAYFVFIFP